MEFDNHGMSDGWQGSLRNASNLYSSNWMFSDLLRFLITSNVINKYEKGAKVLDIGCSDGQLLEVQQIMHRSFQTKAIKYIGIDGREEAIKEANKKVKAKFTEKQQKNITFLKAEIRSEKFISKLATLKPDIVAMLEVIEHFEKEYACPLLKAIANGISKNGKLVISTPIHYEDEYEFYYKEDHVHEYSYKELEVLLNECGFEIETPIGIHVEANLLKKKLRTEKNEVYNEIKKISKNTGLGNILNCMFGLTNKECCKGILLICKKISK